MLTEVKPILLRILKTINSKNTLPYALRPVPMIPTTHKSDNATTKRGRMVRTQNIININMRVITIGHHLPLSVPCIGGAPWLIAFGSVHITHSRDIFCLVYRTIMRFRSILNQKSISLVHRLMQDHVYYLDNELGVV